MRYRKPHGSLLQFHSQIRLSTSAKNLGSEEYQFAVISSQELTTQRATTCSEAVPCPCTPPLLSGKNSKSVPNFFVKPSFQDGLNKISSTFLRIFNLPRVTSPIIRIAKPDPGKGHLLKTSSGTHTFRSSSHTSSLKEINGPMIVK